MTDNASSEILNPGKKAFDFPTFSVSAQFSAILRAWLDAVASMWSNHFNAIVCFHFFIQGIAVIGPVANELFRNLVNEAGFKSLFHQSYFVGASRSRIDGDWKTSSVCNCHDLGALAALSFANT